jgi:hypothetical protein
MFNRLGVSSVMAMLMLFFIAICPKAAEARSAFFITPEGYGAVGDGVHDDTVAMNAALASLTPGGKIVLTGKYLIASASLVVPCNVTMEGSFEAIGTSVNNYTAPYDTLNSAIILSSSYTINLGGGSTIKGLLIRRQGQTFPAADATGFAGTAITPVGDDHSIIGCMILGFNKAIYSTGCQRQYYNHILGDNLNFIEVTQSYDIGRIIDCHAWPFVTIAYTGSRPSNWADRSVGYYLHDGADWCKMTNCFAYGYTTGINVVNSNSVTLLGCGVDGTVANVNSVGISIIGQCHDVRLDSCQIAAQAQAIYINTGYTPDYRIVTQIVDCDLWGNLANGSASKNIYIQDGDAAVIGSHIRNGYTGVYVNNIASRVMIEGNGFDQIANQPIFNNAGSPYVFIGLNDYSTFPTGGNVVYNPVLQTATVGTGSLSNVLLLPASGDVFSIPSGTGNFTFINGSSDNRIKTLLFNGSLTITSSTSPGGIRLSNNAAFNTAAGTSLSLILGPLGYWIETGRSNP